MVRLYWFVGGTGHGGIQVWRRVGSWIGSRASSRV
jgi:hypothetical protein